MYPQSKLLAKIIKNITFLHLKIIVFTTFKIAEYCKGCKRNVSAMTDRMKQIKVKHPFTKCAATVERHFRRPPTSEPCDIFWDNIDQTSSRKMSKVSDALQRPDVFTVFVLQNCTLWVFYLTGNEYYML